MSLISDKVQAKKFAHAFMGDIYENYADLVEKGIKEDNFFDLLREQIEEARTEFNKRVIPEIATNKIFDTVLVDVLVNRAYKYKTSEQ